MGSWERKRSRLKRTATVLALMLVQFTCGANVIAGQDLNSVKERGILKCGVSDGLAGFSSPDSRGVWRGLDVDFCRAVAAAVLGDSEAVVFIALNTKIRFTALHTGEIDILSRNTTWTLGRDTLLGLNFAGVWFYDGQGFLVPKSLAVTSAKKLDGATICMQAGTTSELNVADFFRANEMNFEPVVFENVEQLSGAFFGGRCDAFTGDVSGLAAFRSALAPVPDNYVILPEVISKEPLGPAVRHGDDQMLDIVKWTLFALIQAEELGITSQNVEMQKESTNPNVQRLLGVVPGSGEALGLRKDWAYNAIAQVGNYGEIYDRNVGPDTPLGLQRGLNALWTNGGLMYAPPIR